MAIERKGKMILERTDEVVWAYDPKINTKSDLSLLDNVQFIYELSLAELELKALGINYEITNGLRDFKLAITDYESINIVKKQTAYFKSIYGKPTDYFQIIQKNITRSVNQYLTHWIYPYKGKFHPQMIRALLNIIGLKKGDTVLEPFSGSGTTALEAQLLGINCVGIDVSPLCVLQGKVKTLSMLEANKIKTYKSEFLSRNSISLFNQEGDFYKAISDIGNETVQNFYILARLLSLSDNARRGRNFDQSLIKNIELMIQSVDDYKEIIENLGLQLGNVDIKIGDARNLNVDDNSIDGIITSPPYSIALDYVENDAHALKDLGHELEIIRDGFVGVRGKPKNRVELYNEDMIKSYQEMYRVLKFGKFAVIVIGNATYQGKEVKTVEFTISEMEKLGFRLFKNINKIIFGLYNVMKRESILIFKKE